MRRDDLGVLEALKSGAVEELEELAREIDGFPDGLDSFVGRRWILNAIDVGAKDTIDWMLRTRVDLAFSDEKGYTPLHSALQRKNADRHLVLDTLLTAGMAAALDDVEALGILVRHGADLAIRTDIDDHATPLEEARNLGKHKAAKYLEGVA
jgi:hypothetical protein